LVAVEALSARTPREVIDDHLRLRAAGDLDASQVARAHYGVRSRARKLARYTGHEEFHYDTVVTDGDVGFLEWSAGAPDGPHIRDGADSSWFATGGSSRRRSTTRLETAAEVWCEADRAST
jgi:hypothetical protein